MNQSLYVDPDGMRGSAGELDSLASETAQLLAQLKADLAEEGECWGDDKPGKVFAESYVPSMERSMQGFENLVQNVSTLGTNLRTTAENFESRDREAASQVQNTFPDSPFPDLTTPEIADPSSAVLGSTPYRDQLSAYPSAADQPGSSGEPDRSSPTAQQRPESSDPSVPDSPLAGEAGSPPTGEQRSSDAPATTAPPGTSPATTLDGNQPNDSSSPEQQDIEQPSPQASPSSSAASPAAAPSRSAVSSSPSQASPAARRSVEPRADTPSTRAPSGPRVSAPAQPGAPGNPASPWSKPSSATAPEEQHAPPRPASPRRPDPAKAPEPEQRKKPKPKPPRQPVTSDEAMQIVMAMAARHNLQIAGFESSGLDIAAARDIADAVDAVLHKYPLLPLHGIEVGSAGDEKSTVANRRTPEAPEAWIVLDRSVVAKPHDPPGRVRPWTQQADTADSAVRIRMLQAFGQVVDLTGGFRARQTVQRALITEYLRITGTENRSMSHVVDGYRRWRDQLDENCFRDGGVNPGRALAWGFAEVEHSGARASDPAKVLHRLLLVMARLDMRQRARTT